MADRWCTSVRKRRARWAVELTRKRASRREVTIIVSWHDTRYEAEVARAVVRLDPAVHWRQPRHGPVPAEVGWNVGVRHQASGWKVTLTRRPRGERKRCCVVATCATEAEAQVERARIRLDPAAHWREPREDHPQARAAKQRAALRRIERERSAPAERQPEPLEGGWLLGCGLHEAARPVHPCPACARAAELTEASLREATSHAYPGQVRRMREEAA